MGRVREHGATRGVDRALVAAVLAGMALATGLSVNLMLQVPLTGWLLFASGVALVAALPGVLRRWLAIASPFLAALGLYVLWRILLPPSEPPTGLLTTTTALEGAHGLGSHLIYYGQQLHLGLSAYREDLIPLTLDGAPQLRLLVVTVWYVMAWVCLWIGISLRRPVWGAAALAGVLAVWVAMQSEKRGVWSVLVFLVLMALLLGATRRTGVESRAGSSAADRPAAGVGGPGDVAPTIGGSRVGLGPLLLAAGCGTVAAGLALSLLFVFPSVARPGVPAVVAWDPLRETQGPRIVFNWRQNYPQLLDPSRNFPVMLVTSSLPTYWKANTLEVFTGDSWLSGGRFLTELGDRAALRTIPALEEEPPGSEVVQVFDVFGLSTTHLFTGGFPKELALYHPIQVFLSDSMALRTAKILGPRFTYRVSVIVPSVRPVDLVGLGREYPQDIVETYLQLPLPSAGEFRAANDVSIPGGRVVSATYPWVAEFPGIYTLNQRIVGDAEDPYEIVLRVERYLRSAHSYSLEPPESELRSPYAAFLLDHHKGYCQHFSGAAALLLRLNGVPARVAVGFVTGQEAGPRTYQVTTNNAHAWTEAYFPGVGWIAFEPTPGRFQSIPGASAYSPGFVDPFADPIVPSPGATDSQGGGVELGDRFPEDAGLGSGGQVAPGRSVPTGAWVVLALGVVLVGWPASRWLALDLVTRVGDPERRMRVLGWRLEQDLVAWGLEVPGSLTLDEIAALAWVRARVDLSEPVAVLQAVLYGGAVAREEDVRAWRTGLKRIRRNLRQSRGLSKTLVAWYGCRRCKSRRIAAVRVRY